jgi:ketosteroid isomerase-like protein
MSESTTDEAGIRTIINDWAQAVRAQDVDGVLKHHSDDILLFDVPLPIQSRGIDDYRTSWELFFRSVPEPVVFDLSELSITAGNDVGIRLTVCLRKTGGQWTVTHEHHSEPAA